MEDIRTCTAEFSNDLLLFGGFRAIVFQRCQMGFARCVFVLLDGFRSLFELAAISTENLGYDPKTHVSLGNA